MKILWITNSIMPELGKMLGVGRATSGHWVSALAESLTEMKECSVAIAAPSNKVKKLSRFEGQHVVYYVLPACGNQHRYEKDYEKYWRSIRKEFEPDVVDIHGTEYPFGLSYVRACGAEHVVVTVQGLVSEIEKYYYGGMSVWEIVRNTTVRDLMVEGSIFKQRRLMRGRGVYERELIGRVSFVIGRTMWDYAHVWAMNADVRYFVGNEALRDEMYEGKWCYDGCIPHSIYVSQGYYPLKGLHVLLRALPLVRRFYPDVKVRVAGGDPIKGNGLKDRVKISGYGKFLRGLIKKYKLEDAVEFVGSLNATMVRDELLRANVFVSPSSVENSSNAIGEAQLLGVPYMASYVGGSPDIVGGVDGCMLYRFDDAELLAYDLCRMFEFSQVYDNEKVRMMARKRHDKDNIVKKLMETYEEIHKR